MHKGSAKPSVDLSHIRTRLDRTGGREYWRSLEELADSENFREFLDAEFPQAAVTGTDSFRRRDFLKLMGASLVLAGLGACTREPDEKIVPYVRAPEQIVPGKPLFYATAFLLNGVATGILAESHMGRPVKIEGNRQHPASLGTSSAFAQASVLTLYDPDRSQVVTRDGMISTWDSFLSAANTDLEAQRLSRGRGLRVLTETVTSPTLTHQLKILMDEFPEARWHQYEPVARDSHWQGSRLAFGEPLNVTYRFDKADTVLSLDADFLFRSAGSLRYSHDFAARRRITAGQRSMNRLYAVESTPSLTGAMADHRWPLAAREVESFARAVARGLGVQTAQPFAATIHEAWIEALVRDLKSHRGSSIVLAGEEQPPIVHALAHAMNHELGNLGQSVFVTEPIEADPIDQMESLRELVQEMRAGSVEMLIILGGNPVYTAPSDLGFVEQLARVRFRVHLSLYEDETSALCQWHIPEAHPLEVWSDARAYDGTVTILQPLIAPLYHGKSAHELLSVLLGESGRSSHDSVRDYWMGRHGEAGFERFWQTALHDGLVGGTEGRAKTVRLTPPRNWQSKPAPVSSDNSMEIVFRPDPTVWDGRFANNGWLQELPKPLSKLTWDNAGLISPAAAERLNLANGDLVEFHYRDRTIKGPVWIVPGQPDNSVTLHLGYGRTRAGRVGTGAGFNAYALRNSEAPWFDTGLQIRKTGQSYPLASTQHHHSMEGRHLVRAGTFDEYQKHPDFAHSMGHEPAADATLYPQHPYDGYAWGMSIDLNACIGCNACVVACQSENNIPVVGKDEVARGRAMHWLRIDRYFKGGLDNPETYHQPVPCMHCENAPCEPVCPVGATVHSSEGLNEMVYNRCVGTRYCSNNCPYKVRRFNFFQYADFHTASLKLLRNPDVTVRTRGIMEKCTYCVQRINGARIEAKKESRKVRDGEIVTACQQACPADAIVFGDLNDPKSRVSQLKASPRNYALLGELNTRPRTTYLAKLRNPNPEIEADEAGF